MVRSAFLVDAAVGEGSGMNTLTLTVFAPPEAVAVTWNGGAVGTMVQFRATGLRAELTMKSDSAGGVEVKAVQMPELTEWRYAKTACRR